MASSSTSAAGREENGTLPPLPEITVEIPRTPMRTNTDDTLTAVTDDASPATLAPERYVILIYENIILFAIGARLVDLKVSNGY